MTKHLTPDERESIIAMYHDREKIMVIAAVFKIHEDTVARVVKRAGIPVRWHRNCGRIAAMRAAE